MFLKLGKTLLYRVTLPPPLVIVLTVAEMVLVAKEVYDKHQGHRGSGGGRGRSYRN